MYEFSKVMGDEHERLAGLFRQYQALRPRQPVEARRRLEEFTAGLERHMAIEEQILFPRFEDFSHLGTSGPTTVMRGEHREIRHALARLRSLPPGTGAIDELEMKLLDALRAHEAMEDLVFNPWIDESLNETERLGLFEKMHRFDAGAPQARHE